MTRSSGYSVDAIRGRLLHQQLLEEARQSIAAFQWAPTAEPPVVPHLGSTDSGTLRAVVVAS